MNPRLKKDKAIDSRISRYRVSIIVRYDFNKRKWAHSPGILLTETESVVLASLIWGATNKEIEKAVCLSQSRVEKILIILRQKFHTSGCPSISRKQLQQIASDLFI
jgi:hypothetical protein